jgi:hypothetical protein
MASSQNDPQTMTANFREPETAPQIQMHDHKVEGISCLVINKVG